ncbi:YicC/YloC family endoribonuclease [Caulobacter sp. KR2-114]|uniref:YicC/YloC family endoribonuclease n=1 Tax=Caulobacter sp. KR2-114 TaxID=3400912 RepID=UPI003BFB3D46
MAGASLSGMTGFARHEGALGEWSWAVEARSVNGRSLEVRFRGPPGFDALERAARELAQQRFQRGQLTVNVQARRADGQGGGRVNREVLERYLKIAEEYVLAGLASQPRMDGMLALRGVIDTGDDTDDPETRAAVEAAMAASLALALDGLKTARQDEGRALAPVLAGLVDQIEALSTQAEAEAAAQVRAINERVSRRLTELAGESATPERIVQEAAALALKADVREELDRLKTHVTAARALMAEASAQGRRLDFLTQEFMREANTLCSKSATTALTAVGLALKAAIDQLREQIQNVE